MKKGGGINKFRLVLFFIFFLGLFALALVNLFIIQIHRSSYYTDIGKKQYNITVTQKPARAEIYDRKGKPLALNKQTCSAFVIPSQLEQPEKLEPFLLQHFPQAHAQLQTKKDKHFMYIKRHLSDDEKTSITQANLPDIKLLKEASRLYTVPSLGHTVGTTDIDNNGIMGIEHMFDQQLAGIPTTYTLEKDARSECFYFKKETTVCGAQGTPLTLTLDSDIQFLAYDHIKEHVTSLEALEGTALVIDPTTGEILAMACYPDFDPNKAPPENLWLTKNRILTEVYEPGSVMKVFPAIAALDEGIVTPETMVDCGNTTETYINGQRVSTWKACGAISYTDVIRFSNNIGTSKIALKLGKKLYPHLCKCGFGKTTGLNFLGEQSGFVTPPEKWSKATPLSLSFGYEIAATPLQIALGFCIIANNGYPVLPQLYKDGKKHTINQEPLYPPETMKLIKDIITLDQPTNTAYFGNIKGYTILGKTGTARLLTHGEYDPKRLIFTFAGIIDQGDYKRVIVVSVREPKDKGKPVYAATIAAPLFRKIAQSILIHDKI